MSRDALSSRRQDSPLTRRSRDLSPPSTNCLEVQWRFLQHKNPKPPQFASPTRQPLPQILGNNNSSSKHSERTQSKAPPGSPSRLFHMFETQQVGREEPNTTLTSQTQQDGTLPDSRASRTLNDLMGETQRKAMLDRILADMEYLAVEPTYSRLGQPEDTGYDPERRRRQRRKLQQLNQQDEGPRIFWQKSTGAKSAVDIPERLHGLALTPSPPHRLRSSQHIILGRRSHTPHQQRSRSSVITDRRRSKDDRSTSPHQPPKTASSMASRRHVKLRTPTPTSPPASPPKVHYGSWYVPQSEWWTLHQIEQQTIIDKFPALGAPANCDAGDNHCHGSPTQRQHKPQLPSAAPSPRSHATVAAAPGTATASNRDPSTSPHGGAPPSAPSSLELQVASIPQSYIGREYRAYIVSTGSAMPQYLQ
ncbi:uncharacterized protein PITG_10785 [Phytophthora infestans T30-4]|uniref:Uncharacterized protein n=1 Tax=Phytophthora infestans (strain T30-4) TaxID=403677 RepID=D0NH31_PHYIT|nr:uncharacterized protein PITG_10785 [Phytophthora infestans T30-4]EEY58670.1 conserved hypothetical protein [Phytophthora infestans T30-4]|eukprot:XP_002901614.1 conserved hypothetical protein [Phytophthora infestans T30-4]